MSFFVDTSLVRGQVNAGQAATFTLKAGGNVIATSHTTGADGGGVEGTFKHNGVPVLLDRGDKITGTFASDAKIDRTRAVRRQRRRRGGHHQRALSSKPAGAVELLR